MNSILFSAFYGLLKGVAFAKHSVRDVSDFQANVIGPLHEEAVYRVLPHVTMGRALPRGFTAFIFATDHLISEYRHNALDGFQAVVRFADVFAGGLLYEAAFRRYGYLGAVLAHAAHNTACGLGRKAAQGGARVGIAP